MELIGIPLKLANSTLTVQEQRIYDATLSVRLANLDEEAKLNIVGKIFLTAKSRLGLNTTSKEDEMILRDVLLEDLEQFKGLTEVEILSALKSGLNGEYLGKNESSVFFNSSNFVQWVKKYIEQKAEVMKKVALAKKIEPAKPKPTDAEMKAEAIAIANSYVRKVAEAENKDDVYKWAGGLNFLYDIANDHKLIPFTGPRKREILALCNNDIDLAKSETYKLWITEMAENGCTLDENGEMI